MFQEYTSMFIRLDQYSKHDIENIRNLKNQMIKSKIGKDNPFTITDSDVIAHALHYYSEYLSKGEKNE